MKNKLFCAAALTLALSMGLSTFAYAGNSKYFTDVNDNSYGWACEAVDYLWENNIAKGTGENNYSPQLYIERGDFVLLLNNSFDLGQFSGYMYGFSDVPDDSYYHDAIVNAKGSGVIKDNFAFYPEQPIMRGDAMNMLYRALDLSGYIKGATTDLSMYKDADSIRDVNSQIAVATLTQMGIISGNGGNINFADYMSRAEMAMVFYKALTYAEANPTEKPKTTETSEKITTYANKPQKEEEPETKQEAEILRDTTTKSTVTIDGKTISGIEKVDVTVKEAKTGVEVTNKANATITDSAVHAKNANSSGILVTGRASADITGTNLYTSGSGAVALRTQENAKTNVKDSNFNIAAKGSFAVKSGGETNIDGSQIYISDASGIAAEDNGEINIRNCDITANGVSNGLFVSTRGSRSDVDNKAVIKVSDTTICGDRRTTLFYSDKNDLEAELRGCPLEKIGYLVNSRTSAVETENTIVITLNNQEIEADVIAEEYTRVIINLENGSVLKGSINQQNTAKYVEVNVEAGSQLELTSDSYIDVFKYNDAIDIYENGYTIYYDKDNSKNDWLFSGDLNLANGGKLSPE